MNDTLDPTPPRNHAGSTRKIPSNKKWFFFALFFLFAVSMYASTWYRITTAGFMGTGKKTLAPANVKSQKTVSPPATTPK